MDTFHAFLKSVEESEIIGPADRILVGVSGGVDSVVLLDMLYRISGDMALTLFVAHVNHGLRGRESERDEGFVRRLAGKYGCKIYVGCNPPQPPFTKGGRGGINIQSAARDFRYNFFVRTAGKIGANKIALAHHADDQAETFLLHLVRGAGPDGLCGMRGWRQMEDGITLIRPLLGLSKGEIISYATSRRLKFVIDRTNRTRKYDRNIIRHDVLPMLGRQNPSAVSHICRTSSLLREESEALDGVARDALDEFCKWGQTPPVPVFGSVSYLRGRRRRGLTPTTARIARGGFNNQHIAIRRRVIRLIYKALTGSSEDLLSDHINRMIEIADGGEPRGSYRLPKGMVFRREADTLIIRGHTLNSRMIPPNKRQN